MKIITSYVYDAAWKDKLKSYNGVTISYGAFGISLDYMGHNQVTIQKRLQSVRSTKLPFASLRREFFCALGMGDNLAVKACYALGSRKH